ncbi:Ig-like domain-containing protein [Baaleninema sp.]|uniref:Ig-like domain-containing protein n=1 Tax=Baaleninema sp. TaxID=3101197 RepID=UPI003D029E4C
MLQSSPSARRPLIVVIDAGVSEIDRLLNGLVPQAEAVVLPRDRDGIAYIEEVLAKRPQVTQLHVVSHGKPGCLFLGNAQLNLDSFSKYRDRLRRWGETDDGRRRPDFSISLYGCQVAAGDAGAEFVETLHRLTLADIAASTSLTGCSAIGGNWELEVRTSGRRDRSIVFDRQTREKYSHVFGPPAFSGTISDVTVDEDASNTNIDLTAFFNDLDQAADTLIYAVQNDNSSLVSTSVSGGQLTLDYAADASGTANLKVRALDNDFNSDDSNTFTVIVNPVNDRPEANDVTETTDEDTTINGSLASAVSDIDDLSSVLTFEVETDLETSKGAKVTIDSNGNYSYDPTNAEELQALASGQSTTDSFSYTVKDDDDASATGTVTITVTGQNDSLNALDDQAEALFGQSVSIDVLANDIDPDGDDFILFSFDSSSANGGSISRDGDQLVYSAPPNFLGDDTFTYRITDAASSDTATVTVTVNTPPIAEDDIAFTEGEGQSVVVDVLANDSEPDANADLGEEEDPVEDPEEEPEPSDFIRIESVEGTAKNGGSASIVTNNTADPSDDKIRYTPPEGYNGPDRFEYTIEDKFGGTATATVVINPADAIDDDPRTKTNRAIDIDVLDNDRLFGPVSIVGFDSKGINGGSIELEGDLLVFTPADDFQGFDLFEYTIEDSDGNRDTASVRVLVADEVELPQPENPIDPNPYGNRDSVTVIPPIQPPSPNVTLDTREGENETGENVVFGDEFPNTLQGKPANDIMSGLAGDDNLYGAEGDDQLFGNSGNDFLKGEIGNDLMFAGAGNDFLDGGDGDDAMAGELGDDILQGGIGNDLMFGNGGFDRMDGGEGADTILGGKENDVLTGNFGDDVMAGEVGIDTVQGGDGNDLIFGNQGNDILDGSRGDDSLLGGQDDDILFGADGDDWLKGDLGNDVLVGGDDNDRFVIVNDGSIDTIGDFTSGEDKIDLSLGDFQAEDIVLQPSGNDTLVKLVNTDTVLAIVQNISFEQLGSDDFSF